MMGKVAVDMMAKLTREKLAALVPVEDDFHPSSTRDLDAILALRAPRKPRKAAERLQGRR